MTSKSPLALLVLMVLFSPLAIDIFLPALPVMAQQLNVSLSTMQWSITVFILSLGVGQLVCGPLADIYGRKPVALAGVAIYALSSLLTVWASDIELVLVARLFQGLGACAIVVAAFACVRDQNDALQSGVLYSYLNGAICCIPALAPLLGNILTEYLGWRSNFVFMAAYAVFAGIIIALTLRESRPVTSSVNAKFIDLHLFINIIKHPVFLFNALLVMLAMAIIIAYVTSAPAWLMVHLGLDRQGFVFWFSINAVLNVIASLSAPKALIKFGARVTIGMGMVVLICAGFVMLLLIQWHDPLAFMLPIMLSSVGFSLVMGACAGQALAPFGNHAGTASALLGFMQMSGAALLVGCLQIWGLDPVQQLALLMLSIVPFYVLFRLPYIKKRITIDAGLLGNQINR
jgi:DHA1 family bicyclomycin/chloramphenicol resistance-like MFS transporter